MRTSPAVPGFFGEAGESGEVRIFTELLDGSWGLVHNLASLLLTNCLKRDGAATDL